MRKLTTFMAIFVIVFSCAACKPTPETASIVEKSTQHMLTQAQVNETPDVSTSTKADLYSELEAPEQYSLDLTSSKGSLTVHVDAKVDLPSNTIPIIRVQPSNFSMEQVKLYVDSLFNDDDIFIENQDILTQSAYKRQTDKLQTCIENWDTIGEHYYDMIYDSKEMAEKALNELYLKASNAPKTLSPYTVKYEWQHPQSSTLSGASASDNTFFDAFAMPDNATYSMLYVSNDNDSGLSEVTFVRDTFLDIGGSSPYSEEAGDLLTISKEDALSLSTALLQKLQLDDFQCSAIQTNICSKDALNKYSFGIYDIAFTRTIEGVSETYTNDDVIVGDSYSKPWRFEKIHVLVGNNGILSFKYQAPYTIVETVMNETRLLPFSTISDIFEKMIVIVNNQVDSGIWGASAKQQYVITSIKLGLMNMREQGQSTGLLVPVWDFLGYDIITTSDGAFTSNTNQMQSYLTINAIDGSIISRGMGY